MKEYIKKFANPAAADQYAIKDIPFITSVDGDPIQNLHCNLSGKKLVNVSGIVEVQSAGPEMVDLGLSVKWANANVGATNGDTAESWYGGFYAWGETETKSDYSWATYKYANGDYDKLTKYCPSNETDYWNGTGSPDNKLVLDSVDDIATVKFGSNYRMPTKEEIEELIALPNQWVTDYNGISGLNGRIFTGTNGNTLFIPADGYFFRSTLTGAGSECDLWSSSLYSDGPTDALSLYFDSDIINLNNYNRYYGFPVRCVSTD